MPNKELTIATFNCNSIRQRLEIIIEWLAFNDPDILCLQETKVQDHQFPADEIREVGFHVNYKGMKSYNGVAIISREEPDEVQVGFDDAGASDPELGKQDEARLIMARFGTLRVVNTYVPQGYSTDSPRFQFKLEWLERLKKYFDRHFTPRQKVLWTGDLNCAPTDADVHDPVKMLGHVCFNPELTEVFNDTVSWGFVDVFRQHIPDGEVFTFWDYRQNSFNNNKGWRIDHLMATKPLARKCVGVEVDTEPREREKPSDHTFVTGRFEL